MNETFLHGAWRTVVTICALLVLVAGGYVLLHAVGLLPPLYAGSVVSDQEVVQPNDQPTKNKTAAGVNTSPQVEPASPVVLWFDLERQPLPQGLLWMLGGVLAMAAGLGLMALGLARVEGAGHTVVLRGLEPSALGGAGRVTVSMRSLHALVTNVAERIDGVREADARLRLKRAGWHIDCTVAHMPEVPLPEIAQQLKHQLKETMEHHTGLPVARINVAGRLGLVQAQRRVH